jgi:hypothetical protein
MPAERLVALLRFVPQKPQIAGNVGQTQGDPPMKLTAALFAVGLATMTAAGAFAQTPKTPTTTTNRATVDDPAVNQRESRNYDALVGSDSSFRSRRMQTECGSIESPDLKQQCMQSFGAGAATSGTSGAKPLTPARGTR